MSLDLPAIRSALRALADGIPGLIPAQCWENGDFTPTVGTPWLRKSVTGLPSATPLYQERLNGGLLFDFFFPAIQVEDAGIAAKVAYDALTALKGSLVAGTMIRLLKTEQTIGAVDRSDPSWWHIQVRCAWLINAAAF